MADRSGFACKCGCGFDSPHPRLLVAIDALERVLDDEAIVTSGCRCFEHNKAVMGTHNSYHLNGMAADVVFDYSSGAQVIEAVEKTSFAFGGFHYYPGANFIHVDVRGYRSRW